MATAFWRRKKLYIKWTDAGGVRHYEPCSAPTKTETRRIAEALERKAELQRRGHEPIARDSNLNLSEVCEWWLQNRCKPARACNERFRLQRHVLSSTLGAMPVRSVTGELIERQFRKMESAGLSAWTVIGLKRLLSTIYRRARKAGLWVGRNPFEDVEPRRIPKRIHTTLK